MNTNTQLVSCHITKIYGTKHLLHFLFDWKMIMWCCLSLQFGFSSNATFRYMLHVVRSTYSCQLPFVFAFVLSLATFITVDRSTFWCQCYGINFLFASFVNLKLRRGKGAAEVTNIFHTGEMMACLPSRGRGSRSEVNHRLPGDFQRRDAPLVMSWRKSIWSFTVAYRRILGTHRFCQELDYVSIWSFFVETQKVQKPWLESINIPGCHWDSRCVLTSSHEKG